MRLCVRTLRGGSRILESGHKPRRREYRSALGAEGIGFGEWPLPNGVGVWGPLPRKIFNCLPQNSAFWLLFWQEQPVNKAYSKWQSTGKSQWCCSAKCGRPLHVLTNKWIRSKQSANTPPPQSTTPGMVAVKNVSYLLPPRTFKMMVLRVLPRIQLAILCFEVEEGGRKALTCSDVY